MSSSRCRKKIFVTGVCIAPAVQLSLSILEGTYRGNAYFLLLKSNDELSSTIHMQRSQSKILLMITNAPWYVTNQTLHDDLKVPFIEDVIQEKSINHHDKLGNHSNPILQPLLEQQRRRRLKKLWPADLIDG
jgi:hypothetical protein